jgi:hypothetical protein
LDEEINNIEEEIARIKEYKKSLKYSSLPGSPISDSKESSIFEEKGLLSDLLDELEVESDFSSDSACSLDSTSSLNNSVEEIITITSVDKNSKSKKKMKTSGTTFAIVEHNNGTSFTIHNLSSNSKRKSKAKTKTKKTTKRRNVNDEVFKLEEILKIRSSSQDQEDEEVDIL